ncbi:MAG: ATP-dependent Clp protease ATP-binding subunit [bacterium]|nr:ATP-dependent Clp protease ATP-binding subunit [bacterium]
MLPLICHECHGASTVRGAVCSVCSGGGAAVLWADTVLTFGLPIDRRSTRGRALARRMRIAVTVIVLLVALMSIAVAALLDPTAPLINRVEAMVFATSFRGAPFWFAMLLIALVFAQRKRILIAAIPARPQRPAQDVAEPVALVAASAWDAAGRGNHTAVDRTLSPMARRTIEEAGVLASRFGHATVEPIHVLAAAVATSSGASVLGRLGVDSKGLTTRITFALRQLQTFNQVSVVCSPEVFVVLFSAYVVAAREGRETLSVLRILHELADRVGVVQDIFADLGITPEQMANVALWVHTYEDLRTRVARYRARSALRPRSGMNRAMTAIATPVLDQFGTDLTQLAARGATGPVVGRDHVFREVLQVFASGRRGIVLVGEHGVGKRAIVEGLAERMIGEDVPALIADHRLVVLEVARLTSGAAPEEAQERLMRALYEATKSQNIVLVVEQLEHLVGGAASLDLDDVLAGEVERGQLTVIGTTTPDVYAQYVEGSALGRLLQRIPITPPEGDDAIRIVAARSIPIEGLQRVFFTYEAIDGALTLGGRYLHDHAMPEQAVILLEEAAAAVRAHRGERALVTREDIAKRIEEQTGVRAGDVARDEAEKLLHLEQVLHERMVGQDEAVSAVAAALRRARAGMRSGKRPIATFLFLGATGVGKTELAKTVADAYFGSEEAMVRLDMSEYQEQTSVTRLIGAPPGHPGADAGGQLTEAVRHHPFSIVLLDELEKAHPDILNLFLQVFEDGRLTDARGRTIDFTNTILIATSNAGAQYIQDAVVAGTGQEEMQRTLMERELRGTYRPEFLNRFDGVVVFTPLTQDEILEIARRMLAGIAKQLAEKGIHFRATDAAIAELAAAGFDPQFGARPLRRVIQERVQNTLAEFLLQHTLSRRDTVVLDVGGALTVTQAESLTGAS